MKLFKTIIQNRGFKIFPLILLCHVVFIMVASFLAVQHNYFFENIYTRLMIYQILAGLVIFVIILIFVHQSEDDKILNLMALIWLQGTNLFLDLTILFRNQFTIINLFLFLIGIFVFIISVGLAGGFLEYLSIKKLNEDYAERFFNGYFSPLTLSATIASFILFVFLIYLNKYYFNI